MICEKCGKSNIKEVLKCIYCGANMPPITECRGFADILSMDSTYKTEMITDDNHTKSIENRNLDIIEHNTHILIQKSEKILKKTYRFFLFGLICVGICIVVSVTAVVINAVTIREYKENTNEKITQIEKEQTKLKEEFEEKEKSKKTNNSKDDEESKSERTAAENGNKKEDSKSSSEKNILKQKAEE